MVSGQVKTWRVLLGCSLPLWGNCEPLLRSIFTNQNQDIISETVLGLLWSVSLGIFALFCKNLFQQTLIFGITTTNSIPNKLHLNIPQGYARYYLALLIEKNLGLLAPIKDLCRILHHIAKELFLSFEQQ